VVVVTDRVCLAVRVPDDDVERFEDYLHEKYGMKAPYAGIEIERELRTLREHNDLASLEDEIDRVLRAAGRRPTDTQEKNILTRSASDGPTTIKNYRIHEDVRAWFVANYDNPGRVVGRLMRYIADGGTIDRLLRRFHRVADDAEALLADLADGDESSAGAKERRRRTLFTHLAADGTPFDIDNFDDAVDDHLTGIDSGDYAREEYLESILDRANYTRHPLNPDVFVPEERAREIADFQDVAGPDAPTLDRFRDGGLRYDDLSRDDKVRGLRIAAARRAAPRGTGAIHSTDVVDEVFDGNTSASHAAGLIDDAANADGFGTDTKRGTKRLTVNLRNVDRDVLKHVEGAGSGASTPTSDAEPPASTDEDDGNGSDGDGVDDVDEEMGRLMNATAVTDGGVPDE